MLSRKKNGYLEERYVFTRHNYSFTRGIINHKRNTYSVKDICVCVSVLCLQPTDRLIGHSLVGKLGNKQKMSILI